MPSKAGAEGMRYICPQCFTAHYRNDVLFATRRPFGSCDMRQAAYRYALSPYTAFTQWCKDGESAALLNWRVLPQSRRQWKDGVITAVRDLDGSWVTQRVCPCCHTPLSPSCPVVFGWKENGMDGKTILDLLYLAVKTAPGSWKMRRDGCLPLRYDYLVNSAEEMVLGVPVALEHAKGSLGRNILRRCCSCAAGLVVRLNFSMNADGQLDDSEAFCTLYDLLEACGYSDVGLNVPAVFLLDGLEGQPDAVALFQRECPQLSRSIQYNFENSYFAVGAYDSPQAAVQAVEWLSGHIRR